MDDKKKLTRSESGKLGNIAAQNKIKEQKQARINIYNQNPTICQECKVNLPYEKRNNKFCNHKCSAQFNNILRLTNMQSTLPKIKVIKLKKYCNICSSEFSSKNPNTIHCVSCVKNKMYIVTAKNTQNILLLKSDRVRRMFLIHKHGIICSVCKNTHWNNAPIPIELDHIDGNSENNLEENLRLICPNCHAQTDTYKGKNIGKGRAKRMKRYNEGKSF